MTAASLLPFMPRGNDDLLIRAAVAPVDLARPAWQAWSARRPLEEANWAEVRMLPSIAARASELGIAAEALPRLEGIRRFVWANSQKKTLAVRPVLEMLNRQGIPFMLLKGAAIIAGHREAVGRRYLRDVDVLAPSDRIEEVIELIWQMNWCSPFFASAAEAGLIGLARAHAVSFEGPDGEIDVHRFALAPNVCSGDDDRFWQHARTGAFVGQPCRLPASEHLLIATLEHSVRRDPDHVLDWSLDAARLIGEAHLDWPLVIAETRKRRLAVPVEARLRYLRESCGLAVPDSVLTGLADDCRDPVFIDEYLSNQYGGLKLPGGRRRARLRAQQKRIDLRYAGSTPPPMASGRSTPMVLERIAGRRFDILLPDRPIRRVKLEIDSRDERAQDWRCLLNCGALTLRRLVGGSGLLARLRRRLAASVELDPRLCAAQSTDCLSLYVLGRSLDNQPSRPIKAECSAAMRRPGELLIKLKLYR